MLKVGAGRDYDLDLIDGVIKTGERGIILRCVRGKEKFLCFLGLNEARELATELQCVAIAISDALAMGRGSIR